MQNAPSKPKLSQIAALPTNTRVPSFYVDGNEFGYDIFVSLVDTPESEVSAYLSSDKAKLNVVGTRLQADGAASYLWVFDLPNNVEKSKITFTRTRNIVVVHIPKIRSLVPRRLRATEIRHSFIA